MNQTIQYPYKFEDSKTEVLGTNKNKMDLYSFSGESNIATLKMFCKEHKDKFLTGTFYFLVIFDEKENVIFPTNPLTEDYDIEEEPQKHIRASYTFNRLNGYSKLNYYEKNKWESIANSMAI